ncbi:putative co-chaperone GrpE [Babesia divergens]|uniref:GrpE protein homolog n=1 Tax=Babesia divergens TaxID=32595 RepID=A0AAD9LHK1_BABDI|nr:putative co-chaperone GrpE [Babesia divergens]
MKLKTLLPSYLYRIAAPAAKPLFNAKFRACFHAQRLTPNKAPINTLCKLSRVLNIQFQHRRFTTEDEKERSEAQETDEHTQADEASHQQGDIPDDAEVDLAAKVADLEKKILDSTEKLKEMQLKYRISLDNCEQMERINAKKLDNANLYAITRFAKDMLDVADAFELAFKSLGTQKEGSINDEFIEGIRLTEMQLHKTFEKYGIKRFQSLKETFNPEIHEAMFEIPDDAVEKNTILQVVFNGYMIHDRVLRAAKVGVSRK